MQSDNPAARLFSILDKGSKLSGTIKCRAAWSDLLNADHANPSLLMSRIGKLMELPQQIIKTVQAETPSQAGRNDHWSGQVNKAFMQQDLNGQWATFSKHIDAHVLNYLSMISEILESPSATKCLSEGELNKIRDSINELLKEIMESDTPDKIKHYISKSLHNILLNVDEYIITGAQPIMDGVEVMFGHAFSDPDYREYLSDSDFGTKLVNVLSAIASSVTIALGAPQVPDAFSDLLKLVQK